MRTIWQALAWKEWHEHKWKLAAAMAVLCGYTTVMVLDSVDHDGRASELLGMVLLFTGVYGVAPLSVFLGATDAGEELGRGIQPFTQSLPVPMWQAAGWKLLFGLFTCVLPIVAVLALTGAASVWLLHAPGELARDLQRRGDHLPLLFSYANNLTNQIVSIGLISSLVAISIYLWTAAVGVNRKNEVWAGAVAILTIVVWWTLVVLIGSAIEPAWLKGPGLRLLPVVLGVSPGGMFLVAVIWGQSTEPPFSLLATLIIAVVFHALLAGRFIARYGRTTQHDTFSHQVASPIAAKSAWIGPPRRGPLRAIAWKQARESVPIILVGFAGILGFFTAILLADPEPLYRQDMRYMGRLLMSLDWLIGFLVAVAVGIGVFDRDLGPKLNAFWRSRPIHPDMWFWTKFVTGLGVLLAATFLPLFIGGFVLTALGPDSGLIIRTVCLLQVAAFVAALMAICFVRQSVYAAILGGGILAIAFGAVQYFWDADKHDLETTMLICATAIIVFGTFAAWLAVRYDWGRKN